MGRLSTNNSTSQLATGDIAVLIVITLASFLPPFVGSSLNVSAPAISLEFNAPATDLGWLISAFILCCVSLVLPLGRLGDLTSRRALLTAGFIIFTVTSVAIVFVPSFQWLISLRVLQGIGGACIFATSQAILTDTFSPAIRGRVLGISVSAVYVGLAAGPVLGGMLTHHFGWRSVFIFIAIWSLITSITAILKLPPNSQKSAESNLVKQMDLTGSLLYTLATASLAFGLNEIPNLFAWVMVVVGVVLFTFFILYERHARIPLLKPGLFHHNPNFLFSSLSALLNYGATFAVSFLFSIYLQQVKGYGADVSGIILITAPIMQAVLSPLAGRLSDKHSPFKMASLGMAVCGVALVMLLMVNEQTSLAYIIFSMAVIGSGFAIFSSPNMNAIMSGVPREDSGIAVGFVATMRNMGQLASMAVITIIMSLNIGDDPITQTSPAEIVLITRLCMAVFIIVSAIGIFTSMQRSGKR